MMFSKLRYGKADASLTLNGVLAGLVAITAGTASVSPLGALAIGTIAGIVMVLSVQFFDQRLRIDDPVGAISVHGVCGALGTIAVGFFAVDGGILYGFGPHLLLVQLFGVVAVCAWTVPAAFAAFKVAGLLAGGLRVTAEEEIGGLDVAEHGIIAYGDMMLHSLGDFRQGVNVHSIAVTNAKVVQREA